jgi:hypothetical protein
MRYQRVRWLHNIPTEPVLLYPEIDNDGFEVRKIDECAEGHRDTASRDDQSGSTHLGAVPVPSLDAINAQDEFVGEEINAAEFERIWVATQE